MKNLQSRQNKIMLPYVNAPWFVRNEQIPNKLSLAPIKNHIKTKNFLLKINNMQHFMKLAKRAHIQDCKDACPKICILKPPAPVTMNKHIYS